MSEILDEDQPRKQPPEVDETPYKEDVKTRTFQFNLELDVKLVIPETVIDAWYAHAQDEDAEFGPVQAAYADYGDDRESFAHAVARNGLRKMAQDGIGHILQGSGVGGTVSPATIRNKL